MNDTTVNVSWTALEFPDLSIDSFTVVYRSYYDQMAEIEVNVVPPATSCVITGLDSPAVYLFQVFATVTLNGMERVGERSNVTYFVNSKGVRLST